MGFIIFLAIVVFVVIAITSIKSAEKARANWRSAANLLKLTFVPGTLFEIGSISGTYREHFVKVSTFSKRSGNDSESWTRFTVNYRWPLDFGFMIRHQNFIDGFKKMLGLGDVEVGDDSFDGIARIEGRDLASIQQFLTPAMRRTIAKLLMAYSDITITNRSVEVNLKGVIKGEDLLISNIRRLVRFADTISPPRNAGNPTKVVKPPRLPKHAGKPVFLFRSSEKEAVPPAVPVSGIETPFEPPPLIPDWKMSGEKSSPEPQTEREEEKSPEEKGVPPALPPRYAGETPVSAASIEAEEAADVVESPGGSDERGTFSAISEDEFCVRFFVSSAGSSRLGREFEAELKGKPVRWSGKLVSATEISIDFAFGNKPGVKATFEIHELKNAFGGGKIKAVVHLPREALSALRERHGQQVSFSGRLLRLDFLMKTVFLSDGELV